MYTEYKIKPEAVEAKLIEIEASVKERFGDSDILPVMLDSIMKRFAAKGIKRYTDYGPYWWALKDVLKKHGHELGDSTDEDLAYWYRGDSDVETIVMADMFRDYCLETYPIGKRDFLLDVNKPSDINNILDDDIEEMAMLA